MRTVLVAVALFFAALAAVAGMVRVLDASWPTRIADSWKDLLELAIVVTAAVIGLVQLNLLLQQAREQHEQRREENKKEQARETLNLDAKLGEDAGNANRLAGQGAHPSRARSVLAE